MGFFGQCKEIKFERTSVFLECVPKEITSLARYGYGANDQNLKNYISFFERTV